MSTKQYGWLEYRFQIPGPRSDRSVNQHSSQWLLSRRMFRNVSNACAQSNGNEDLFPAFDFVQRSAIAVRKRAGSREEATFFTADSS